jgi:hypothetical protein
MKANQQQQKGNINIFLHIWANKIPLRLTA